LIYSKAGNFSEAIKHLEQARRFIENLKKSNPKDAGYKRNTSITLSAIGQTYLDHNKPEKAVSFFRDARAMSESLLATDANNGETIADLATVYASFGTALVETGELAQGVSLQEKSLEFYARALLKNPENIELKREYGKITRKTAENYLHMAKRQNHRESAFHEKANLLLEQARNLEQ
jgi:tetratricopeptide (TPR) repeat protein